MTVKDNRVTDTSRMNLEPGSWQEASYELYVGLHVGISHAAYFGKLFFVDYVNKPVVKALGYGEGEKQRASITEGPHELKVIGVGYGRTGTYSLTLALEELGYPTLHTQHLYENEEIFAMWTDTIFQPSIDASQAFMGTPDLDLITSYGYQATMDLPMALYFEQVQERFPACKFILTTRENSEIWFRSWDILTKSIAQPAKFGGFFFTNVNRIVIYLRWLFSVVNKDPHYLTAPFPLPDQHKEKSIASYEAHNARVRATIPVDQLLEYNVKQGWEPLCGFLDIQECPTIPFPKSNSARSVQAQAVSSICISLIIILFVVFVLFTFVFQRVTGRTVLQWIQVKYHNTIDKAARGPLPKKIDKSA